MFVLAFEISNVTAMLIAPATGSLGDLRYAMFRGRCVSYPVGPKGRAERAEPVPGRMNIAAPLVNESQKTE